MTVIDTRISVGADGVISTTPKLPAGEYTAMITFDAALPRRPGKPFAMTDYPVHDGPWDDGVPLRREDLYGDDGR